MRMEAVNRMGKTAKTAKTAGNAADCSINNIYRLEGRVPIGKAIPFGLQHILAMFVSNLAPITIIAERPRRRLHRPSWVCFCRTPCL